MKRQGKICVLILGNLCLIWQRACGLIVCRPFGNNEEKKRAQQQFEFHQDQLESSTERLSGLLELDVHAICATDAYRAQVPPFVRCALCGDFWILMDLRFTHMHKQHPHSIRLFESISLCDSHSLTC
jgi:hypothetical protein